MISSKLDQRTFKYLKDFSRYLRCRYSMSLLEYYEKYENFQIPKCTFCESNSVLRHGITYGTTCGKPECISKRAKSQIVSNETREKCRASLLNRYRRQSVNFATTSWGKIHPLGMTTGEKKLHDAFVFNKIYDRFDVVYQYVETPYCIDFAFINEKIAVEFDGPQHFKYHSRIESDNLRDEKLSETGWRTYRISYLEIDTFKISDLLEFIGTPSLKKHRVGSLLKHREVKPIIKSTKRIDRTNTFESKQKEIIPSILSSNINFKKFGWVNEVSKILNKHPQKVNQWMKRFMTDFYENECFKRNNF